MQEVIWIVIVISSLILDFFLEYPNPIHPTVWMGKIIEFFDKHRIAKSNLGLIFNGILPLAVDFILFFLLILFVNNLPLYILVPVSIYLAKSTFSIGGLVRALKKCETDDIENLRNNVSMIVSRNVKGLDMAHLRSAAFESGAESIIDSVISPLFYLFIFGLYGGIFYRIINTADSMLGYRNERYEYIGKVSAKLDDVLNFVPARIYFLILIIIGRRRVIQDIRDNSIKLNGKYSIIGTSSLFQVGVEKIGFYSFKKYPFPDLDHLKKLESYIYKVSYSFALIMILLSVALNLPLIS